MKRSRTTLFFEGALLVVLIDAAAEFLFNFPPVSFVEMSLIAFIYAWCVEGKAQRAEKVKDNE